MATVELFARTEVGCVRERNEDVFVAANLGSGEIGLGLGVRRQELSTSGALLSICDGMGGAAAGHVAAALAAEELATFLRDRAPYENSSRLRSALLDAVRSANARIRIVAAEQSSLAGMGSTLTAMVATDEQLLVAHVGDSRAYLLRGGRLRQLTDDDSLVGHLMARGHLSAEEARGFRYRNVLLQALGVQERLSVQLLSMPLCENDAIILCSDGLTAVVEDEEIRTIASEEPDPLVCCRRFTELACARGAPDNVTVGFARVRGAGLLPAPADDAQTWQLERYDV